ncbi:pectin lyase fold/virulence factor [Xylariaceae sp. FL0255]|nr:pectin lyase fold/virulence factor [Xylariaceae sp. FL0255]
MILIKSNGGSGYFRDAAFDNFMGHTNAYVLDLDSAWSSESVAAGSGVEYSNLTFSHWHGTSLNGAQRPVLRLICPSAVPCTELEVDSFYIWTEGSTYEEYLCENAYGSGPAGLVES